jgi:hypothetical protein
LGNALRIKFETSTMEKKFLEESMIGGAQTKKEISTYNFTCSVNDERVCWPYEGEYWRDELGTYEYTLTKGCKSKEKTLKE